jgi:hypothetical protein
MFVCDASHDVSHDVTHDVRYHTKLTVALRLKEAQARAYSLYATVVTALPLLVTALVIWYVAPQSKI